MKEILSDLRKDIHNNSERELDDGEISPICGGGGGGGGGDENDDDNTLTEHSELVNHFLASVLLRKNKRHGIHCHTGHAVNQLSLNIDKNGCSFVLL
jgi:hypothetical protein